MATARPPSSMRGPHPPPTVRGGGAGHGGVHRREQPPGASGKVHSQGHRGALVSFAHSLQSHPLTSMPRDSRVGSGHSWRPCYLTPHTPPNTPHPPLTVAPPQIHRGVRGLHHLQVPQHRPQVRFPCVPIFVETYMEIYLSSLMHPCICPTKPTTTNYPPPTKKIPSPQQPRLGLPPLLRALPELRLLAFRRPDPHGLPRPDARGPAGAAQVGLEVRNFCVFVGGDGLGGLLKWLCGWWVRGRGG